MPNPSIFDFKQQKKPSRDFHYDIVKNLIDLAKEISIIEKF